MPNIPILMYHHVADDSTYPYSVSVKQFVSHMEILNRQGFAAIGFDTLYAKDFDASQLPEKPVLITFDDAYRSVYEQAFPILAQFDMKATLFVVSQCIGAYNRWEADTTIERLDLMSASELNEVVAAGWEIGSHSQTHCDLVNCRPEQRQQEIQHSKEDLERLFSAEIKTFAYPYGRHTSDVVACVKRSGYKGAVSIFSTAPTVLADPFRMRRIYPHQADSTLRFRMKLTSLYLSYVAFRDKDRDCSL